MKARLNLQELKKLKKTLNFDDEPCGMNTKNLILTVFVVLFQASLSLQAFAIEGDKKGPKHVVTDEQGIEEPGRIGPVPQTNPVNVTGKTKGSTLPSTDRGAAPIVNLPTNGGLNSRVGKSVLAPAALPGNANTVPVPQENKVAMPPPLTNAPAVMNTSNTNVVEANAPIPKKPAPAPVELQSASFNSTIPLKPVQELSMSGLKTKSNPGASPCEDKALSEIYKLLLADNNNVIGIMFELTAMRLAKRTLAQEPTYSTFEDLAVDSIKTLNAQVAKLDKDQNIQKSVLNVYETYGKKQDLKVVSDNWDDIKKDAREARDRAADACYFDKTKRFNNSETSAFVMAAVLGEGGNLGGSTLVDPSKLTDIDAATLWMVERTRAEAETRDPEKYKIGSKNGNMLNVSTRVTRYLGRISDGRKELKTGEVQALIEKEQDKLTDLVKSIYEDTKAEAKNNIKKELVACLNLANSSCADCTKGSLSKLETENLDIDRIQRGLLETVSKSDNLKISKDLIATLGPVYLDFNNIPNPEHMTKESTHDLGADHAKDTDAPAGTTAVPKLPPRGTKEICKKFFTDKALRKKGGRSVSGHTTHSPRPAQTDGPTPAVTTPVITPVITSQVKPVTPPSTTQDTNQASTPDVTNSQAVAAAIAAAPVANSVVAAPESSADAPVPAAQAQAVAVSAVAVPAVAVPKVAAPAPAAVAAPAPSTLAPVVATNTTNAFAAKNKPSAGIPYVGVVHPAAELPGESEEFTKFIQDAEKNKGATKYKARDSFTAVPTSRAVASKPKGVEASIQAVVTAPNGETKFGVCTTKNHVDGKGQVTGLDVKKADGSLEYYQFDKAKGKQLERLQQSAERCEVK